MRRDWRLPENRREAFQRFYSFHLDYRSHPGCVYQLLPEIADAYDLDEDGRAWLTWLNGNTQNVVTSLLLLNAAPSRRDWRQAVEFWNAYYKDLEWDTDRRHQKSKFGEATEAWVQDTPEPALSWLEEGHDWEDTWRFARAHPHMGRLSAWSMIEYARILLGPVVPDAGDFLLWDVSGSRSHRNGLAVVGGYGAASWPAEAPFLLGIVPELEQLAEDLLREAQARNPSSPDVGRLTLESALCTYKSWHKPNRRYPNVYSDMMYDRIRRAEHKLPEFKSLFELLWSARRKWLPAHLRLENMPYDPGVSKVKQNHYLTTGEVIMMNRQYQDMPSTFNDKVLAGFYGLRKERW